MSTSFSLYEVFHLEALTPNLKDGFLRLKVMPWLTVSLNWKH